MFYKKDYSEFYKFKTEFHETTIKHNFLETNTTTTVTWRLVNAESRTNPVERTGLKLFRNHQPDRWGWVTSHDKRPVPTHAYHQSACTDHQDLGLWAHGERIKNSEFLIGIIWYYLVKTQLFRPKLSCLKHRTPLRCHWLQRKKNDFPRTYFSLQFLKPFLPSLPPLNFTRIGLSRYLDKSRMVSLFFFSLSPESLFACIRKKIKPLSLVWSRFSPKWITRPKNVVSTIY